ncbi:MAG: SH3 domain-containing protein [Candidatus Micrarchaeota archaeon]|nr:SH3 domain-containing protein [Candidatus Micrarchaeota archaeon]
MRKKPSLDGDIVGKIEKGNQAKIIDENENCKDPTKWSKILWCKVEYTPSGGNTIKGYVNTGVCCRDGSC